MTKEEASILIKQKAYELGFSACGIAKAEAVDASAVAEQEEWLAKGFAAGMDYMHKNKNLRYDPRELVPGAKSLIIVAMNYYPKQSSLSRSHVNAHSWMFLSGNHPITSNTS